MTDGAMALGVYTEGFTRVATDITQVSGSEWLRHLAQL